MRYWVVSQFYAEDTGTGYSMTRIAEGLAKYMPINVMCGQPHYLSRSRRAPKKENRNGVSITRVASTPFNNDSLVLKLMNMVTISVLLFFGILRNINQGDIVLFTNLPPLAPFFITLGCRMRKAKCIMRIDDVYPELLASVGIIQSSGLFYRFLDGLYRQLYKSVDCIVVLGRDIHHLIARKIGASQSKIVMIPNAGAPHLIQPHLKAENSLLKTLGIADKFVIKYGGHMGRSHDLETLVDAVEKLKDETNIHFLFIGSGPKKMWLERVVVERNLENVTVIPYLPRSELSVAINACDVGIISMVQGMAGVSVPGRIYDLMAAGKPIIVVAEAHSEIALIVQEERIGWIVSPGRADELAQTILTAYQESDRLAEMGIRARLACEEKYTFELESQGYYKLISRVANACG